MRSNQMSRSMYIIAKTEWSLCAEIENTKNTI